MKIPDVSILKMLTQGSEARAIERARALAGEGKLEKAVASLEAALARTPESERLLFEASRCLLAGSRDTDAGECLKRILRRNPRRIDVVLEFIEEVKVRIPAVGSFYDAVAEHYIRQDDLARALDSLERIAPDEVRIYQNRHQAKWDAVQKNAPQAKLTKTSLSSAYYVALALERQGEYPRAAEAYRNLLEKNPEESGRISARLEAILARDYHNLPLRLALADILLDSRKIPEGLGHLEQALEVDAAGAAPAVAQRMEERLKIQPGSPDLLWLLVRARCAEAKFPEMLAALASLAELGSHQTEIIRLLEELTPRMEDHPQLRLALASSYVRARKPVLAVEAILLASEKAGDDATASALEEVAKAFPDHARTHLLLGDLDFKTGRSARGVERYERVLALSPEDGPILVPKLLAFLDAGSASGPLSTSLARIFLTEGNRTRAAVLLRHRVRHDPAAAGETVTLAREALSADPSHAGLRIALAEALLAAGEAVETASTIAQLLKDDPSRAPDVLHNLSAASRFSPEAARAALSIFRDLATRGVLPTASRFGQGEAALNAGEVSEAVSAFRDLAARAPERMEEVRGAFESLLARHPETVEVRYVLAGLCLDQKNYPGAAAELKKIDSLNPDLLAPVLEKYREILRTYPEDVEVRLGLSAALLLSRQFDQVQSLAAETLRMRDDETTAPIQLDLGEASLERGDAVSAVKRYYNAYRKNPSLATEAATRLERLLDLHPTSSLASLALGKILPETGRVSEGVARLLEAFRNDPRLSDSILAELERVRASHTASPETLEARIEILCSLGNDPATIQAIGSLLESRPGSGRSMIPRLEAILSRAPRNAAAFLALARAHRGLGDLVQSAEACRSAYRADRATAPQVIRMCAEITSEEPKVAVPYLTMAEIYLADGEVPAAAEKLFQAASRTEGMQEEVLEILETISTRDSGTARVAFLAAEILTRFDRHAAAVRSYRKALERDPGMLEVVLKAYNTALEKDGGLGEARLARAQALILRQEFDGAVEDLEAAVRSSPSLATEVITEARRIQERRAGSYRLVSLLSDLLLSVSRLQEAGEVLAKELKKKWEPPERLALLVRLWRVHLGRGETDAARRVLAEAETLSPDRDHLLARVHECILSQTRSEVNALKERFLRGERRAPDLTRLAAALLDLGETSEAVDLTAAGSGILEAADLLKIHSEAALRETDYFRAAEILKPLGPARCLAFAAERSGDLILASRTLEQLSASAPDPETRTALQRIYRRLVSQDLEPGRERLSGETILRFGR